MRMCWFLYLLSYTHEITTLKVQKRKLELNGIYLYFSRSDNGLYTQYHEPMCQS